MAEEESRRSPIVAGALSTLMPGLGQLYCGQRYRGIAILLANLAVVGMVAWYHHPAWYLSPLLIWFWNIWDAATLARDGRGRNILLPVIFGMAAAYVIGWQTTRIDLSTADLNRAVQIVRPMLRPDFVETRRERNFGWVPVEVPCGPNPPESSKTVGDVTALAVPNCGSPGEVLIVSAQGLWPNEDTRIWWQTHNGDPKMLGGNQDAMLVLKTDESGSLTTTIRIPSTALVAQPDPTLPLGHRVYFEQFRPIGGIQLSENGGYVVQGMLETIALALMATALAIVVAIPISFLAARNLMSGNPLTFATYLVVRTALNILRSIEALIFALVFVVVVGLGPFAGVIALAIHSVAALAKLYSESIEGIDSGPIEAIRATGANWFQMVRFAVIPQIVTPFASFTIYRWDINVRSATIIGLVGGGGIGFFLIQWIQINDLRAVSAAFIAIAAVVIALDFLSAKIRERLV
jgi:phosphonate transport system permease protein